MGLRLGSRGEEGVRASEVRGRVDEGSWVNKAGAFSLSSISDLTTGGSGAEARAREGGSLEGWESSTMRSCSVLLRLDEGPAKPWSSFSEETALN